MPKYTPANNRVRIEAYQYKGSAKWHYGTPSNYSLIDRLRIEYDKPRGKTGYFYMRKLPNKPNLTTAQRTKFIDSLLPRFLDPYETVND